jgi:hypothetical protein
MERLSEISSTVPWGTGLGVPNEAKLQRSSHQIGLKMRCVMLRSRSIYIVVVSQRSRYVAGAKSRAAVLKT